MMFTVCSHRSAVESNLPNEPVMADRIVIPEKSSQAKDVRAAELCALATPPLAGRGGTISWSAGRQRRGPAIS
jgi:hypothetical protein